MQRCDELIADNLQLLEQGVALIERLDDQTYRTAHPQLSLSGAGSHFRHCMDFYHSFLAGVDDGRINYDVRARNELTETHRATAVAQMRALIDGLKKLRVTGHQRALQVTLENSARSDTPIWSQSSFVRELQSLLSHTMHHYAIIAIALRLQRVEPGREFGVAPSTLEQWRKAS
jgi:hypothetical protein